MTPTREAEIRTAMEPKILSVEAMTRVRALYSGPAHDAVVQQVYESHESLRAQLAAQSEEIEGVAQDREDWIKVCRDAEDQRDAAIAKSDRLEAELASILNEVDVAIECKDDKIAAGEDWVEELRQHLKRIIPQGSYGDNLLVRLRQYEARETEWRKLAEEFAAKHGGPIRDLWPPTSWVRAMEAECAAMREKVQSIYNDCIVQRDANNPEDFSSRGKIAPGYAEAMDDVAADLRALLESTAGTDLPARLHEADDMRSLAERLAAAERDTARLGKLNDELREIDRQNENQMGHSDSQR